MNFNVSCQVNSSAKAFSTNITWIWFFARVKLLVSRKIVFGDIFTTNIAFSHTSSVRNINIILYHEIVITFIWIPFFINLGPTYILQQILEVLWDHRSSKFKKLKLFPTLFLIKSPSLYNTRERREFGQFNTLVLNVLH